MTIETVAEAKDPKRIIQHSTYSARATGVDGEDRMSWGIVALCADGTIYDGGFTDGKFHWQELPPINEQSIIPSLPGYKPN